MDTELNAKMLDHKAYTHRHLLVHTRNGNAMLAQHSEIVFHWGRLTCINALSLTLAMYKCVYAHVYVCAVAVD